MSRSSWEVQPEIDSLIQQRYALNRTLQSLEKERDDAIKRETSSGSDRAERFNAERDAEFANRSQRKNPFA